MGKSHIVTPEHTESRLPAIRFTVAWCWPENYESFAVTPERPNSTEKRYLKSDRGTELEIQPSQ